jgi:hypothetical protein
MVNNHSTKNKKDLNRLNSNTKDMKKRGARKSSRLKGIALIKAIKEAQKDPQFIREINKFIKATTSIHKL